MLNLNVRACFVTAQTAAKKMLSTEKEVSGVVINITSQMGHIGSRNRTFYCITKHALEGLTKAMAIEFCG